VNALRLVGLGLIVVLAAPAAHAPAVVARSAADCSITSTGLVPLTDLTGKRTYRGHRGGLYPAGLNRPPRAYLELGLAAAKRVRPINGRVVLLSIGMSNATQEFSPFIRLAEQEPDLSPNIKLVDGAMSAWDAKRIARPEAGYWRAVDRRLLAAGANPREVQAVWLKTAISGEDRFFPADARALHGQLRSIAALLPKRFPNLRLIYVSSRTYAGYAITPVNPEPAAYHSGFAVRWLVQDRIQGRLRGPWIGWGPYLWTDGESGRADGLTWICEDVRRDGMHPSAAGAGKIARLLLRFFKTDPTSKGWFAPTS
jgi:hypothetical protein